MTEKHIMNYLCAVFKLYQCHEGEENAEWQCEVEGSDGIYHWTGLLIFSAGLMEGWQTQVFSRQESAPDIPLW